MMLRRLIIGFAAVFTSIVMQAQLVTPEYYLSVSGKLGTAALITDPLMVGSRFGIGGGLAFGYEIDFSNVIFQTGLGFNLSRSGLMLPNGVCVSGTYVDSEGYSYELQYAQNNRYDQYSYVSVQIPVMVGYQYKWFYVMAGPALDATIYGKAKSTGMYSSQGNYEDVIGVFKDMPNHEFLSSFEVSSIYDYRLRPNLMINCELGVNIEDQYRKTLRVKDRGRIALYADIGLTDVHKLTTEPSLTYIQQYQNNVLTTQVHPVHILASDEAQRLVTRFEVGIKMSYVLQIGRAAKKWDKTYYCPLCH